ncbi:MAG: universal stress protein [Phycisphaerales bacterium]|nr:universal stress protein [Phycisphaerales bacterium]
MKPFKTILVATNTQLDIHPNVDKAAEIAQQNSASIKIVDALPEFPWTVRLTLKNHEHVRELMRQEKLASLEALAAPIRQKGIDVETKVLLGKASVEIVREVLRDRHDLVLCAAKGKHSRRSGYFGTTSIRLLRECPCAVWLVAPSAPTPFKHVLACIDTSSGEALDAELNDKIYELASLVSECRGSQLSVVHAWSAFGEQRELDVHNIEGALKDVRDQSHSLLTKFLETRNSSISEKNVHLIMGDPSNVIPEFASKNGVDLIVMGTVARSGMAGMTIGNTAERILNSIGCSVLTLKADSFESPIRLGDYINPSHKASGL